VTHREHYEKYGKAWYERNREKRKAKIMAWREANKERYEVSQKRYKKSAGGRENQKASYAKYCAKPESKAKNAARESRRRALKKGAAISDRVLFAAALDRHGYKCGVCGNEIVGRYEIDHIVALSLGGAHVLENLQPAHPKCNRTKGGHEAHEAKRWLF
jgi:5-methylcytosine-specific restriction endonuclease McrA